MDKLIFYIKNKDLKFEIKLVDEILTTTTPMPSGSFS